MNTLHETGLDLVSRSPAETEAIGECCAGAVRANDVVALTGELGAGKTVFVKGLCRGLGLADTRRVVSPTFMLLNVFDVKFMVYHFDAYRLTGEKEFVDLDALRIMDSGGVSIIEWADRVASLLPAKTLRVHCSHAGESERRIEISNIGRWDDAVIEALEAHGT